MLPARVVSEIQRIDYKVAQLAGRVDSEDIYFQGVFSNHLTLAASGLVEKATFEILGEYAQTRGNAQLSNFIRKTVSNNNSLNCEKIEKLLNQFDQTWWQYIANNTSEAQRSAVNSLKTLRDQCAHGHHNGTGFRTVQDYYGAAKAFLEVMADAVR